MHVGPVPAIVFRKLQQSTTCAEFKCQQRVGHAVVEGNQFDPDGMATNASARHLLHPLERGDDFRSRFRDDTVDRNKNDAILIPCRAINLDVCRGAGSV